MPQSLPCEAAEASDRGGLQIEEWSRMAEEGQLEGFRVDPLSPHFVMGEKVSGTLEPRRRFSLLEMVVQMAAGGICVLGGW